jgi:hypothetical protein
MRAWHPAAATCAGRGGVQALFCAVLVLDELLVEGAAFLSSTSSPRFLSPSRRVQRTQRGGKDSKRTVDNVEIEVERGASLR